jgi:hypothetical protein
MGSIGGKINYFKNYMNDNFNLLKIATVSDLYSLLSDF